MKPSANAKNVAIAASTSRGCSLRGFGLGLVVVVAFFSNAAGSRSDVSAEKLAKPIARLLQVSSKVRSAPTIKDALDQLKKTETAIDALVATGRDLRKKVDVAEDKVAGTMVHITDASNGLHAAEWTTGKNERLLKHLSYYTGQLSSSLGLDNFKVGDTKPKAADAKAASGALAKKSAAATTPEALKKLEGFSTQLWEVANPQAANSLDKTEATVKGLEDKVKTIKTSMVSFIKSALKKDLRRSMNKLRGDTIDLGDQALRSTPGAAEKFGLEDDDNGHQDGGADDNNQWMGNQW